VTSIAVFFLGGTISMAGHGQGVGGASRDEIAAAFAAASGSAG
jgi:hypothetical protein